MNNILTKVYVPMRLIEKGYVRQKVRFDRSGIVAVKKLAYSKL